MELFEREREVVAITALYESVREGRGGALLIDGPPGIGKSALLDAAVSQVDAMLVLRARGNELEREYPLGVARQLLSGPASKLILDGSPTAPAEEAGIVLALYEHITELAANEPVLIVVDDMHVADDGSLRLLAYLVRRLAGLPVGVLGALRVAPRFGRTGTVALMASAPGVATQTLSPLSRSGIAQVIEAEFGGSPPEWVDAFDEACGGNPFLLREAINAARQRGIAPSTGDPRQILALVSEGLERDVAARLVAVGNDARHLAHALAALGTDVDMSLATMLAGVPSRRAEAALARLDDAHLLASATAPQLSHPLISAAVFAGIGPLARSQLHLKAARLLSERGATAERVAGHLLACSPTGEPWALEALLAAAAAARSRGASGIAARLLQRALAEDPPASQRSAIRADAGAARVAAGDPAGLDDVLAARAAAPAGQRAQLTLGVMAPMWFLGRAEELGPLFSECLEELGPQHQPLAFALRAARAQSVFMGSGEPGQIAPALACAEEIRGDDPRGRWTLGLLAMVALCAGQPVDDAVRLATSSLGSAREQELAISGGFAPVAAAGVLALAGKDHELVGVFARLEEGLRRRGSVSALAASFAWRARWHLLRGRLLDAEADATVALELLPSPWATARLDATQVLSRVLVERNQPTRSLELAHTATEDGAPGLLLALLSLEHARGLLAVDQAASAAGHALEVGEIASRLSLDSPSMLAWRLVAGRAVLASGDAAEAASLARRELSRAKAVGATAVVGEAQCLLGLADNDLELLEAAERTLSATSSPLEHAATLIELGAARRRAGARAESREPLTAARDLAYSCAADAMVERATAELRAAGARPRGIVRTGIDALTASELRVAQLAASGMTNREIAQRLFVSPKTVETQLYAAFRKLGVRQRTALADAMQASSDTSTML